MNNLQILGLDNWFVDQIDPNQNPDLQIVRVISVNKNSFVVSNGEKDIYVMLKGSV